MFKEEEIEYQGVLKDSEKTSETYSHRLGLSHSERMFRVKRRRRWLISKSSFSRQCVGRIRDTCSQLTRKSHSPHTHGRTWPALTTAQTLYHVKTNHKPNSEVCKMATLPFDIHVASSSVVFMMHAASWHKLTHTHTHTHRDRQTDRQTDADLWVFAVNKLAQFSQLVVDTHAISLLDNVMRWTHFRLRTCVAVTPTHISSSSSSWYCCWFSCCCWLCSWLRCDIRALWQQFSKRSHWFMCLTCR